MSPAKPQSIVLGIFFSQCQLEIDSFFGDHISSRRGKILEKFGETSTVTEN
jgi:hypothetical protein